MPPSPVPRRPRRASAGLGARRRGTGRLGVAAAVLVLVAAGGCSGGSGAGGSVTPPRLSTSGQAPTGSSASSPAASASSSPSTASAPPASSALPRTPQVLASHLEVPWSIAFLPDGSALVTLRDRAQLLHVRAGHPPVSLGTIPGVVPGGEGGLLGVAVSPTYSQDHRVFLYYTAAGDNRVARLTFDGNRPSRPVPILTGIQKGVNHNGGRLKFGPDGYLYVTTGDAGEGSRSQNRDSLNGKILRITQEGAAAPGNPFGSRVWTLGHRNVQGIAWGPDGTMYASEFGQNTWDELNVIRPGRNYGWPVVEGRAGRAGLVDPVVQWPTDDASPSGIAYADGAVYMAALRGESLWRIPVSGGSAGSPKRLLHGTYGRLRDAVLAPDGRLWLLTDNTFRGTPGPQDDRLIAIPLAALG